MRKNKSIKGLLGITILTAFVFLSGCKKSSLIGGFHAAVEPNLQTVAVQMDFAKSVHSDLGGSFAVKDYGTIEIEPSTSQTPFNVGFRLNLDIVNDQDYVEYTPTTVLPTGQPLPIAQNRALAQVTLENDPSSNFDVYAYVDILNKEWLGMAMTLKFVDQKYFPVGLAVSKGFLKSKSGAPMAYGSIFGPTLNPDKTLKVPGGIAVFVNAKALIQQNAKTPMPTNAFFDAKGLPYIFNGPRAAYYRKHPSQALQLEQTFKFALEQNRGSK